MNDVRYCRICWNTQNWQHPTGEAAQLEGSSYVSEHGFGHEEWLFSYGWVIDGYKYGFLQPLQYITGNRKKRLDIILYTVAPTNVKYFVGRIKNCELSTIEDAERVFKVYETNGWLTEMVDDLVRLKVDPAPIQSAGNTPISISNFRFKPADVEILSPFVRASASHKVNHIHRYRPLTGTGSNDWEEILAEAKEKRDAGISFHVGRLKSTEVRNRAAQNGTAFDPTHDRIQNSLYEKLVALYGKNNVGYEENGVDLVVKQGSEIYFYEVKTSPTAKNCIRLAVGQLLEYSHWPAYERAQKLIVVGPVPPTEDTIQYLGYLRKRYSLPVYYCYYGLSSDTLSREY